MSASLPFPFFVGVGRSGTTLLRSIFNKHPELAVAHESGFIGWMARHRSRYCVAGAFHTERFLSDLLDNGRVPSRVPAWGLDPATLRCAVVEGGPPEDLADAVRRVYRLYAKLQGKVRHGDKTPGYDRDLDALADLLPEARFVHLVRDGRDVALATSEVHFGPANVVHSAYHWARRIERAREMGDRLGSSRYLLLRYEDLTDAPEQEVARICDFLALSFKPEMLRYYEQPDDVFGGLAGQAHHRSLRFPVTKGLRDWRRQMPADDVRRFEAVAGGVLADLGYEVSLPCARLRSTERVLSRLRIIQGKAIAASRARVRRAARRRRA